MTTKLVWKNPNAIISCEWLHNNLNNPDIRIYDCTTYLHYKDNDPSLPYIVESGNQENIKNRMAGELKRDGTKLFNLATGISLMLFYAFAMQCMSTLAIVKKETNSWKWPTIQLLSMTVIAYLAALISFQFLK